METMIGNVIVSDRFDPTRNENETSVGKLLSQASEHAAKWYFSTRMTLRPST